MTKSNVIPFTFDGNTTVRVIDRDGESWFVLSDVCAVLGIGNPRNVAAKMDEDEKDVQILDTLGGKQSITIINESGLYRVIMTSQKPQAKSFRKWVTGVVIPSIRKTGKYESISVNQQDNVPSHLESPDSLKLRKVNTVRQVFGERAAAEVYYLVGLERTPAMEAAFPQPDLFDATEITVSVKKKA